MNKNIKTTFFLILLLCSLGLFSQERIVNQRGVAQGLPTTPDVPSYSPAYRGEPEVNLSPDDIWEKALAKAPRNTRVEQIPLSSIGHNETLQGTDTEFNKKREIGTWVFSIFLLTLLLYRNQNRI